MNHHDVDPADLHDTDAEDWREDRNRLHAITRHQPAATLAEMMAAKGAAMRDPRNHTALNDDQRWAEWWVA